LSTQTLDDEIDPGIRDDAPMLVEIRELDKLLEQRFADRLHVEPALTRALVSFQANKTRAQFRWYKFKEGYSASLVHYLFDRYGVSRGRLLDPFVGSGTSLFVARERGLDADGIELLPIGQEIIRTRMMLTDEYTSDDYMTLIRWVNECPWQYASSTSPILELAITRGAYPPETKKSIEKYLAALTNENERVQSVLRFALLCILESVSYTSKDGQYLRWDVRSRRKHGAKEFIKGQIIDFSQAIKNKIHDILVDMGYADQLIAIPCDINDKTHIRLLPGSCLDILPSLPEYHYNIVLTSPPYCNRYDYTRTYALELALLGVAEQHLISLRQQMLSCTVENRVKDLLTINPYWKYALDVVEKQPVLQHVLRYLELQREQGFLNNTGIPRMVAGYFQEMACVIYECARKLKTGAFLMMVNDNVRYAGASISVDLILSSFAEELGFTVDEILVLPNGKGNSSQQMGEHGRDPLRKCVYIWRKR
jgi:hypothetical protein